MKPKGVSRYILNVATANLSPMQSPLTSILAHLKSGAKEDPYEYAEPVTETASASDVIGTCEPPFYPLVSMAHAELNTRKP